MGGGDWMPLATVMIGLHQAGHSVRCFADPTIARDCAWAGVPFDVVPEDETLPAYFVRWRAAGATGPSPLLPWAKAHLALSSSLVAEFRPEVVLSQLCTAELARLIRTECGLRWCCVNSTFYFGPGSRRPFEADFADTPVRPIVQQFMDAIREADLVLDATDALFDPPPPSIPPHHHDLDAGVDWPSYKSPARAGPGWRGRRTRTDVPALREGTQKEGQRPCSPSIF